MVAALVAGPANKNTRAAPGFKPFNIKAAAMGVEDVAHTYIGIPATSITIMDKNRCSLAHNVKSSGKKNVMAPAIRIPIMKGLAISVNSSPYAYLIPSVNLCNNDSLRGCATAQLVCAQPQPPVFLAVGFATGVSSVPKKF